MTDPLPNPNPYHVLDISQGASQAEITKAFTMAMKRRLYSPEQIAKARKSLMSPKERTLADYLQPILPTIKRFKPENLQELDKPAPQIELLPEFEQIPQNFLTGSIETELDKFLGNKIFASKTQQEV